LTTAANKNIYNLLRQPFSLLESSKNIFKKMKKFYSKAKKKVDIKVNMSILEELFCLLNSVPIWCLSPSQIMADI